MSLPHPSHPCIYSCGKDMQDPCMYSCGKDMQDPCMYSCGKDMQDPCIYSCFVHNAASYFTTLTCPLPDHTAIAILGVGSTLYVPHTGAPLLTARHACRCPGHL